MIALAAKRPLAGGFSRRGACPALSAPMRTGDGLLVRLNPVDGGLSPKALVGLCEAASMHGNGVIEVTARGSLQVRGLTDASAASFARAVDRLGIAVRTGVPVQTGVLAGLDPDEIADPAALADMIRAGIAKAGLGTRLGPKVSVVINGGGRTALAEVAADVRLTAVSGDGSTKWLLAIAGDANTARPVGVTSGDQAACEAALSILSEIAATGRDARARDLDDRQLSSAFDDVLAWRSTLPPSGLPAISPTRGEIGSSVAAPFPATLEIGESVEDGSISPLVGEMAGRPEGGVRERYVGGSLIGIADLRDGRAALGVALPFGHTTARLLKTFAKTAETLGVEDIRPAPGRTLVTICGTAADAEELRKQAEALGFITSPDDPRQSISACPGAPDCASGHVPARRMAAKIASENSALLDGSVHLHISGCAKGCAHPGASDLTLVGQAAGIGLAVDATARDEPLAFVDRDGARRAFANLAARVAAERRDRETTAQVIRRIGLSALAEAFGQGRK